MTLQSKNSDTKQFVAIKKSGYEIRTDVLKMALDLAQHEYDVNYSIWASRPESETNKEPPKFPNPSQIVEIASTLYEFVNNQ
jgi:hypothetical protein